MSKASSWMVFGLGVGMLISSMCNRQATALPRPDTAEPTRLALIDMAKVFKQSKVFESKRDALKQQISEAEEVARTKQAALERLTKNLQDFEKGTEDRAEVERMVKKAKDEFEAYRREEQARFLKAESTIYREIYELATSEVAKYCRDHGIDVVIRFNGDPLPVDKPQELLQSMNRQIVYENGLDITDEIILAVNQASR